jgi:AcrR family transcriptional regulator
MVTRRSRAGSTKTTRSRRSGGGTSAAKTTARGRPRATATDDRSAKGSPSTRLKILEGATRAFARGGYTETTVDDIIAAAGVSRPSFYKFFANKDEVFDHLHESFSLSMIQMIKGAVLGADDALDKLENGTEAFLRCIAVTGPLARTLHAESQHPGSRLAARYAESISSMTSFFESEGVKLERGDTDPLIYQGLVAAIEAIGLSLVDEGHGRIRESDIERCKRTILQIMRGTLAI